MTRARDLADSADKDIAGTLTLDAVNASGVITGLTVEATGDTAAGDNAALGYTAAEGLVLTGQGSTNDVTIKNDADAVVLQVPTGTTNVNVIGSLDVATNAVIDGTALVTGVLTTTAATVHNGGITLPDDAIAKFGGSADLQIWHDSSDAQSYIADLGTGNLNITSNGTGVNINKGETENMATFAIDGAVTLYHNNVATFATNSSGIQLGANDGTSILRAGGANTHLTLGAMGSAGTIKFGAGASNGTIGGTKMTLASTGLSITGTLATGGNVGVGVAASGTTPLTVAANSSGNNLQLTGRSGDGFAFIQYRNSANNATNAEIGVSDAKNMQIYTNGTERMRITSGGTVGFGTTSPSSDSKVTISNGGAQGVEVRANSSRIEYMHYNRSANAYMPVRNNGLNFEWYLQNGAKMALDGSGNLLVGKTAASDTTAGFQITGGNVVTVGNGSGFTYQVNDGSAFKWRVNANGGVYNFSSNNVNLSDQREKKNIEALGAQWDAVKAWSVKEFHYNEDENSDAKKVGVIAQDVETNHPNLVTDFELSEDKTRKAVKEQQLMWLAIKALQEAQARIETLETKVAALEG